MLIRRTILSADASVVTVCERLGETKVLTLDRRDFSVVRPRHSEALTLLPRWPCAASAEVALAFRRRQLATGRAEPRRRLVDQVVDRAADGAGVAPAAPHSAATLLTVPETTG